MKRLTQQEIDKIIADAQQQLDRGIFFEPRAHFDTIHIGTPAGGALTTPFSSPETFQNGEQFPHHITHLTFSFVPSLLSLPAAERSLQRVGAKFTWHDNEFPNRNGAAIPLFQNAPTCLQPAFTQGTSMWRFEHPVVLSARDSLRVTVKPLITASAAGADGITTAVGFHGVGVLSRRPYFLAGEITTTTINPTEIPAQNFRNDSSEPIAIYDQVVMVTGGIDSDIPDGDTRRVAINVKQTGNGTSANWYDAVAAPDANRLVLSQMPVDLLGVHGGRAISHKLAGEGWVWLPGDSVFCTLSDLGLDVSTGFGIVHVAALGYVVVK